MRYIVEGEWEGRSVRLMWRDGNVTGPPALSELLGFHARLRRAGLGPPLVSRDGRRYDHEGLSSPTGALLLMHQLLDQVVRVVSEGFEVGSVVPLAAPPAATQNGGVGVPRVSRGSSPRVSQASAAPAEGLVVSPESGL